MLKEGSELLKSVTFRFKKRQNRLLIARNSMAIFEHFLRKKINNEVVIINTNIGLGVYYVSKKDYSEFIKENVLLHALKNFDIKELVFVNNHNLDTLKENFSNAVVVCSNYPRLFLAYAKKFMFLRKKHAKSTIVMPVLNTLYERNIKELYKQNKLPFAQKIMAINNDYSLTQKKSLWVNLAYKMTRKEHLN